MTAIPLYPRGKILKNLLSDWKKETGNNTILVSPSYDWNSGETPIEGETPQNDFYKQTINYWYFSEIGFEVDEIFIKRFNDIYYTNIDRFTYILNNIRDNGYSWERLERNGSLSRTGKDTDKETGSKTITNSKSGQDVFRKGVTTTSSQETSNQGSKLTRNIPNEELGVEGTSETTVTDSGEDTTIYGGAMHVTETPNLNKEKNYNSTFSNDVVETREKLSLEEIEALQKMQSVYKMFALLFENIFMEVL